MGGRWVNAAKDHVHFKIKIQTVYNHDPCCKYKMCIENSHPFRKEISSAMFRFVLNDLVKVGPEDFQVLIHNM